MPVHMKRPREDDHIIPFPGSELVSKSLPCERFQLVLKVTSLMVLPPYKGGIFRSAFGNAFRRAVCVLPGSDCGQCILREKCLYLSLFEPSPPPGFEGEKKFRHAPPPYVLNPPLDNHQAFRPGETLAFDLVLMGRAIDALPYFVFCFIEMGRRGLGRERGRYDLTRIDLLRGGESIPIYNGENKTLSALPEAPRLQGTLKGGNVDSISVKFLTPIRLKEKGRLVTELTFPLFFERLAGRIELLSALYGTNGPFPDLPGLMEKAHDIQIASQNLHWYDWARYSVRQKSLMKLGGLRGEIRFKGNLGPYMPYLRLGEMINAGQGTSFGLGKNSIEQKLR